MYLPKLEDCMKYLDFKCIPISKEIYADIKTPIEVLRVLKANSKHCYLLESVENQDQWGRYTFLGFDPIKEIIVNDYKLIVDKKEISFIEPNQYLRSILDEYKSPRFNYLPPFTGGLVGYFAYDFVKYSEPKLKLDANNLDMFMDVDLMLFDKVIAFDHLKQKMIIIVNIKTNNLNVNYEKAVIEIERIINLIKTGKSFISEKNVLESDFEQLFTEKEYCDKVIKAKRYIYEGDIFQVVLSNRFKAKFNGSLFDSYRILRTINPSPYMFYFSSNTLEIAGASPETLVKLEDKALHTFPLAGTRKRGLTLQEDQENELSLLNDEKELAEHNMLVDLGRNDLGRIAKINSVNVEKYLQVLRFSHVMHLGSTVKAIIKDEYDALDAIKAILPAGTLSGAPKFRAMEIINELEQNKRGIYGGAIGYIDFTGNMDTCIAIRIAYKKDNYVYIRSGAGIVEGSNPLSEYLECMNKAKAVIDAIKASTEEIK